MYLPTGGGICSEGDERFLSELPSPVHPTRLSIRSHCKRPFTAIILFITQPRPRANRRPVALCICQQREESAPKGMSGFSPTSQPPPSPHASSSGLSANVLPPQSSCLLRGRDRFTQKLSPWSCGLVHEGKKAGESAFVVAHRNQPSSLLPPPASFSPGSLKGVFRRIHPLVNTR